MLARMFGVGLAWMILIALLIWSAGRLFFPGPSARGQALLFFVLAGASLLLLRWPQISWPHEIQVDESQMLAQAMRFFTHPVPWRDVDGMTGGPLDSMILTAPMLCGAGASWAMARVLLLLLNGLTLVFLYLILRCFRTQAEAQFALLPTIFFYALAAHPDFTHYSSETLPALLIAGGLYLLLKEWRADQASPTRTFLLGLLLGTIPFAKIQAAPVALFLTGIGFARLVWRYRRKNPAKTNHGKALLALSLGALTIPALILGVVFASGAFRHFWESYILASASYTAQESFWTKEINFERVLFAVPDFRFFLYCSAGAMCLLPIAWLERKRKLPGALFWPFLIVMAECVLGILCLLIAGKDYYHYALLLVPGFTMMFGLSFFLGGEILAPRVDSKPKKPVALIAWKIVFIFLVAAQLLFSVAQYRTRFTEFKKLQSQIGPIKMSLVSGEILTASRPGDAISVWGWMPAYHVETQIPPASRFTVGDATISDTPRRDYFRSLYLADLEKSPPAFFIDAIAGNTFQWYWINPDTHEKFPALAAFITDNYALWQNIHMTNQTTIGSPIRIYVRKDRFTELKLKTADQTTAADPLYLPP